MLAIFVYNNVFFVSNDLKVYGQTYTPEAKDHNKLFQSHLPIQGGLNSMQEISRTDRYL